MGMICAWCLHFSSCPWRFPGSMWQHHSQKSFYRFRHQAVPYVTYSIPSVNSPSPTHSVHSTTIALPLAFMTGSFLLPCLWTPIPSFLWPPNQSSFSGAQTLLLPSPKLPMTPATCWAKYTLLTITWKPALIRPQGFFEMLPLLLNP